jgi:hypothetical protein
MQILLHNLKRVINGTSDISKKPISKLSTLAAGETSVYSKFPRLAIIPHVLSDLLTTFAWSVTLWFGRYTLEKDIKFRRV